MGIGSARGEDRAVQAAELAISSPLLEASIDGAHGVLLSIQGGSRPRPVRDQRGRPAGAGGRAPRGQHHLRCGHRRRARRRGAGHRHRGRLRRRRARCDAADDRALGQVAGSTGRQHGAASSRGSRPTSRRGEPAPLRAAGPEPAGAGPPVPAPAAVPSHQVQQQPAGRARSRLRRPSRPGSRSRCARPPRSVTFDDERRPGRPRLPEVARPTRSGAASRSGCRPYVAGLPLAWSRVALA